MHSPRYPPYCDWYVWCDVWLPSGNYRNRNRDAVVVSSVLVEKDDACCPFGKAVGSAALHLAGADDLCPPCRAGAQSWPLSSSTAAKFLHALTKSEGRGMHLLLLFIEGGWYGPTWVR